MTLKNGLLGEIWILVGGRYTGKTTWAIKKTKDVPIERLFVNEFHGSKWRDAGRNKSSFIDKRIFIGMCLRSKDSVWIFEDATGLFHSNTIEDFILAMSRTRDEGVTMMLMFHSWRKVPNDIIDMIDGVVCFKTRDKEYRITDKTDDPRVLEAWKFVMASTNFNERKIVKFIHHK